MDKIRYLKDGKNMLRGIIAQRKWLLKHKKGYLNPDFARKKINELEYHLSRINRADQMKTYLERKEAELRFLIPSTNKRRIEKLREMLHTNLN